VRRAEPLRWKRIAQSYMRVVELLERFVQDPPARLAPAIDALRWQIADQGLRIFHQTRRMPDDAERAAVYEEMRVRGTDRLILRNARGFRQAQRALRRIAEMRLALATRQLLSFDAERLWPSFARGLRPPRAP